MMEGTVNPDPQTCHGCGQPAIRPRISSHKDRFTEEVITEAEWVCHRCGSRFASGVVSREPKNEE